MKEDRGVGRGRIFLQEKFGTNALFSRRARHSG